MRELKFRAWDGDSKQMNYSNGFNQILFGGAGDDIGIGLKLHWSVKNSYRGWHRKRSFNQDIKDGIIVIEQYTGLKDKNGVEIFEGDILACEDIVRGIGNKFSIINYPVKYSSRYSCFSVFESQVALQKDYANHSCEVIGNIHENPELLK
jgi:uncharacterized phage protein (TIGR01671 family)